MTKLDMFNIDILTGVVLNRAERVFESNDELLKCWQEAKNQEWSHVFVTPNFNKMSVDSYERLKRLLILTRGGGYYV